MLRNLLTLALVSFPLIIMIDVWRATA